MTQTALPLLPSILILAAGSSSRMRGGDKLLEPVAAEPLLARIARIALETGLPVTVALPPDRPARVALLEGMALSRVTIAKASEGMAESLKAGIAALPENAPILLLLADLPEIDGADLAQMIAAWRETPDAILRGASATGEPGHPVLLPAWLRGEIALLHGDEGAKQLFARHKDRLRLVPLPGRHAVTDLDTPEDWQAWREATGS